MKRISPIYLIVLAVLISPSITAQSDTLRIEFGTRLGSTDLVLPPNTVDGWGSADGGVHLDSLVFHLVEVGNSYTGTLAGSEWISYGTMLSKKEYPYMELGLGYYPDTIIYRFLSGTDLDIYSSDVFGSSTTDNATYELFTGTGSFGIDSLYASGLAELSHNFQINPPPLTVGTTEVEHMGTSFKAYPSPFNDQLSLELPAGVYQVEVYDQLGRVVHRETVVTHVIDLEALAPGNYIINATNAEKSVYITKVLKQ